MSKKFTLLTLVATLVLSSCVRDNTATESVEQLSIPSDASGAIAGSILVKFKTEYADELKVAGSFTRTGELTSGITRMDVAMSKFGATKMERIFPEGGRMDEAHKRAGLHLWYEVQFDQEYPLQEVVGALENVSELSIVEYNRQIKRVGEIHSFEATESMLQIQPQAEQTRASYPFNDSHLSKQWHYANEAQFAGAVAGADINLLKAWELCTGSPDVIVAIVDGGISYSHPDLTANMWVNTAEQSGTSGTDDDGNGYTDDIYGYNFARMISTINPESHGTHVAGTVAAVNNNGRGVCGIAGGSGNNDGVKLMSCQIFDGNYTASTANVAKAIIYACDNGAVICQNSWGYSAGAMTLSQWSSYYGVEKTAIDYFIANAGKDSSGNQVGPMSGGLVVFAAGNDGAESQDALAFPGAYSAVLSVAAMSADYSPAYYTCYGSWVDVTAPGGCDFVKSSNGVFTYTDAADPYILSTGISSSGGSAYTYSIGTSMACPHVSGVAALAVSYAKQLGVSLTAANLKSIIENSTHNFNDKMSGTKSGSYTSGGKTIYFNCNMADYKDKMGTGHVDAYIVLRRITGNNPPVVSGQLPNLTIRVSNGGNINLSSYFSDPDNDPLTYSVTVAQPSIASATVSGSLLTLTAISRGTSTVTVTTSDGIDNVSQSFSVTVINEPPVIKTQIPNQFIDVNTNYSLNLLDYFSDADNDALTYSLVNTSSNISISVSGNNLNFSATSYGTTTIAVTASDGLDSIRQEFTIVARDNSKVAEFYPNPVVSTMYIRMGQDVSGTIDVDIYTTYGSKVRSGSYAITPTTVVSVDMSTLPAGNYMVEVSYDEGKKTSGIITKK